KASAMWSETARSSSLLRRGLGSVPLAAPAQLLMRPCPPPLAPKTASSPPAGNGLPCRPGRSQRDLLAKPRLIAATSFLSGCGNPTACPARARWLRHRHRLTQLAGLPFDEHSLRPEQQL